MTILTLLFLAAIGSSPTPDTNTAPLDPNGPTVVINYDPNQFNGNNVQSFMYFIPLISISRVSSQASPNNDQLIGITSYEKQLDDDSFTVICRFKITGQGYNKYIFEPNHMVATHLNTVKKGQPLTEMLDWIKFQGQGLGRLEVHGLVVKGTLVATKVDLFFTTENTKSPVTVGIYSISPSEDGKYDYNKKFDVLTASVQSLSFKRTASTPKMAMKIESLGDEPEDDAFWSQVKAMVVNIFIPPTRIAPVGNDTMLLFGQALANQQPTFTFPRAEMLNQK